jgi:anti-anti-sigma factor
MRSFEMEISKEKKDGVICIRIEGSLDASNSSIAKKGIRDIMAAEGAKLVIDLSKLQYISSAGFRVILVIAKDVKNIDGKLVLCSMTDSVKKSFDISGFTSMFDIRNNLEAALKMF